MTWFWREGGGPRDIDEWAYRHLVLILKCDPDRVSTLKCVDQADYIDGRPLHLIRIFDPQGTRGFQIRDFSSLDEHPDLILFEGQWDMETGEITILPLNADPVNVKME